MSDPESAPHTVREDVPAQPEPETREETIERVVAESDRERTGVGRVESEDPTTRRGVNRFVARRALAAAGLGAIVGALGALVLGLTTEPLEVDGPLAMILFMIIFAFVGAIIGGMIASLLLLEREDGAVEEHVEATTPDEAQKR